MNLLENAVTHAGDAVAIEVTLSVVGVMGQIAVQDNGPGIPPMLEDEVFQRFRRGDAARSGGGVGLGLSIVDAIARCHGGSVYLAASSVGARFEILLPLSDSPADA